MNYRYVLKKNNNSFFIYNNDSSNKLIHLYFCWNYKKQHKVKGGTENDNKMSNILLNAF